MIGGLAAGLAGQNAAAGALAAQNETLNNRVLHPQEKPLAQKVAASAAAQGITNPDGSPITVDQVQNAMRAANNSQYGESITTGMVVPLNNTTASQLYDTTGMKLTSDGAGNSYLVQDPAMLTSPSDTLRNLIQQNTGGANSPYSWNAPSPETAQASGVAPRVDPYGPFTPNATGQLTAESVAGVAETPVEARSWQQIQQGQNRLVAGMVTTLATGGWGAAVESGVIGGALAYGGAGLIGGAANASVQYTNTGKIDWIDTAGAVGTSVLGGAFTEYTSTLPFSSALRNYLINPAGLAGINGAGAIVTTAVKNDIDGTDESSLKNGAIAAAGTIAGYGAGFGATRGNPDGRPVINNIFAAPTQEWFSVFLNGSTSSGETKK